MREIAFPAIIKRVRFIDVKPSSKWNGAKYTLPEKVKIYPLAISVCYEC